MFLPAPYYPVERYLSTYARHFYIYKWICIKLSYLTHINEITSYMRDKEDQKSTKVSGLAPGQCGERGNRNRLRRATDVPASALTGCERLVKSVRGVLRIDAARRLGDKAYH